MNKKELTIQYMKDHVQILQCPICHTPFTMQGNKSVICGSHHTFDIAKQGYLNILTHQVKSNYDKALFQARSHIINESRLYTKVHDTVTNVIHNYTNDTSPLSVVDLGCGEGSHLKHISSDLNSKNTYIGIDLSKEGIQAAAKNGHNSMWLVGDLANIPLQNKSVDVLLNLLSPANYKEFRRIAKKEALCIKIVPRKNYLRELRDFIHKPMDDTNAPKELFQKQVDFQTSIPVQYTQSLQPEELLALCQMTPLMWGIEEKEIQRFIDESSSEITMDIDILIGKMNE